MGLNLSAPDLTGYPSAGSVHSRLRFAIEELSASLGQRLEVASLH